MDMAQNWLVLALASPIIWAAICLIDNCFVGKGLFRSAMDGPVIAGLFCIIPLSLMMLFGPDSPWTGNSASDDSVPLFNSLAGDEVTALLFSVLAALFYSLHIFFYFRTLFKLNDSANTESILALSVALVPILAWFLLGERLSPTFYVAVGLTATGLMVSCWSTLRRIYSGASCTQAQNHCVETGSNALTGNRLSSHIRGKAPGLGTVANLLSAVFCFSAYMVLQAKAFDGLDFVQVSISFNATMLLLALLALLSGAHYRQRIHALLIRYFPIFLCAEGLELAARLAAQRAIEIGPSVTAVALVQCLLPPLIILASWTLMGSDRLWQFLTPVTRQTLALQCEGMIAKTTLLMLTMIALVILQQDGSLQ